MSRRSLPALVATRNIKLAMLLGTAATLAIAGCSSPKPTPTQSPTPTKSPTATATATSAVSTYKVNPGGKLVVVGFATQYLTSGGGIMRINSNGGSGSGRLAAGINIVATSTTPGSPSGWELNLVTNAAGVVVSGSLVSPGVQYKVISESGKINFLTTENGILIEIKIPIKVQNGTEAPTTMTGQITGAK